MDLFPAGHLIVGVHASTKSDRANLLRRLIAAAKPKGKWAIRNSTDRGERTVEVVFEQLTDAEKLGHALEARRTGQYPGWASQRVFGFDDEVVRRIEAVLSKTGVKD